MNRQEKIIKHNEKQKKSKIMKQIEKTMTNIKIKRKNNKKQ